MHAHHLNFNLLPFSTRDKDYVAHKSELKDYITDFPSTESLLSQAKIKQNHHVNRKALVNIIQRQYQEAGIRMSKETKKNVNDLAKETTFTLITAHQPSLLTGPLYYVFKILSCLNISEHLNSIQSEFKFVPVFLNGGEDHDFEEIASMHLYQNTVTWDTDQTGSVGRMHTDGIEEVIEEVFDILGKRSKILKWKTTILEMSKTATTYGQFQNKLVDFLFGKYGLVQFSSDDIEVKELLLPLFKAELEDQFSYKTVIPQQETIRQHIGYNAQAYVREINLFYLEDGIRNRIELDNQTYRVVDSDMTFTVDMIPDLTHSLSPNVILRPLTQEYILPNVAYIGGGGELSYWLDRKLQFDQMGIPLPILIRRNSGGMISQKQLEKWESNGFDISNLFLQEHEINTKYIQSQDQSFDLTDEMQSVDNIYATISEKADGINPTLGKSVKAMSSQHRKQLIQLESRLKREIKQKHEVGLNQILKVRSTQLPQGKLQERHDNIFQYLSQHGPELIDQIKLNLPALSNKFTLMVLDS